MEEIYLEWYRDIGNGQAAATGNYAEEYQFGIWPMARIRCESRIEAEMKWKGILDVYGVNAMTRFIVQA